MRRFLVKLLSTPRGRAEVAFWAGGFSLFFISPALLNLRSDIAVYSGVMLPVLLFGYAGVKYIQSTKLRNHD